MYFCIELQNLAIRSCTFLERWKIARLTPVLKKGDMGRIQNYHPIAIINNFGSVFEKCLVSIISPQIRIIVTTCQQGFINKR